MCLLFPPSNGTQFTVTLALLLIPRREGWLKGSGEQEAGHRGSSPTGTRGSQEATS